MVSDLYFLLKFAVWLLLGHPVIIISFFLYVSNSSGALIYPFQTCKITKTCMLSTLNAKLFVEYEYKQNTKKKSPTKKVSHSQLFR